MTSIEERSELTQEIEKLATNGSVSTELSKLLDKRQQIEQKLVSLEKQIYALEGSYLQDTRNLGNILTGWDSYLSSRGSGALKRPMKFKESDRLFSLSSLTSTKSVGVNASSSLGSEVKDDASLNGIMNNNILTTTTSSSNVDKTEYKSDEENNTTRGGPPLKQQKVKAKGQGRPGRPRKNKIVPDDDDK